MTNQTREYNIILLNIIPLGYYYYTRLKYYCNKFPCHLLVLAWESSLFLIPTVWFYYTKYGLTLQDIIIIGITTLLLYVIYEIGYLINDTITDKRDTRPRRRPATRALNKKIFIITRIFYIIILYYYILNKLSYINILAGTLLLIYGILAHNLTFNKAHRYATFTVLRLAKYLFVPIFVFGMKSLELYYIIIIIIPTIVHDVLLEYGYKYLLNNKIVFPRYIKYGVFIPLFIILVGLKNAPAYAHLVILSFVRRRK